MRPSAGSRVVLAFYDDLVPGSTVRDVGQALTDIRLGAYEAAAVAIATGRCGAIGTEFLVLAGFGGFSRSL